MCHVAEEMKRQIREHRLIDGDTRMDEISLLYRRTRVMWAEALSRHEQACLNCRVDEGAPV